MPATPTIIVPVLPAAPAFRARTTSAAVRGWFAAVGLFWSAQVSAQAIDTTLWVTNGQVNAVVRSGNTLFISGTFTHVGPSTGGAAPLDLTTGVPLALPKVNGIVNAVAPDGAGGWYIGGDFTAVHGIARQNVARILSNNNVAAWNPGANGVVNALAVSGGTVYAGGSFTSIGGQARNQIAALDATTGNATAWDANANGAVSALAVSGNTVYAGGTFSSIGGQTRNRIAALDATVSTNNATAWNPNADGDVLALLANGSTVYAGGNFTTIGGQTRNRIAALDATTGSATAWDPNANGIVNAVAVSGSTVYAGGSFTTIGGQARNRIAALDATSGSATAWNPNATNTVFSLVVSGSTVYAGGSFTFIGGQLRSRIAALDASTGSATAWDPNAGNTVFALAVNGSVVYAGGSFTCVGAQWRNSIAALDATTGVATAWNPSANGSVVCLAVSGNTVYAGGYFNNIGGQNRGQIAALDAATGSATAWNPSAAGFVNALAVSGNVVYAGGSFTSIGGQARNRIAALDAATGNATAWNPNANGDVFRLAVGGSTVYAGGTFTSIGGQARNNIAALDIGTGSATSWNPDANGFVGALAVSGNTVYAGGVFSIVGGQARSQIAALDATTGNATAWNPSANNAQVSALAVAGGAVYAGGVFTSIGGQARNYLAALDATTGSAVSWNPNSGGFVSCIAVSGSTVYVGGPFTRLGVWPQSGLAAIAAAATLSRSVPANGGNGGVVTAYLYGGGLAAGSTAKLARSGQPDIVGTHLAYSADGSYLRATFDLNGAQLGAWDIVVTIPDGQSATLAGGFTIETLKAPALRVSMIGRSSIRGSNASGFDLVIANPGNVDAMGVPLWIAGLPLDATVTLDFPLSYPAPAGGEPDWSTVPLSFTSAGGKYLPLVIPRVPPGTVSRGIHVTAPGTSHPPFQLVAALTPPWADGNKFRSCIAAGGVTAPSCMGARLDALQAYLTANPDLDAMSGIAIWAQEAWQCEGSGTLPAALVKAEQVLDYLEGPVEGGPAVGCEDVLAPWWREVHGVTVVSAVDPNDKLGAQGTLSAQQTLPYSIRFENLSTATAPAQQVVVSDALDAATLDLNTMSLDVITFGNRHMYPPPGLKSYSTRVDLRPGKNLLVDVAVSLDPFTHVVTWYLSSIDPVTGQAPADPMTGFLPPNLTPPEGEGSVLFTVLPKSGLTSGSTINNAAAILFDIPPVTNTPTWTNGYDNSAPASHVLPLSAQSNQKSIPVTWTADGNPPDLRDFTIYVKQDAGPYRAWRTNTPATSDTLAPPPDHQPHTYVFYSVARDQIGNIEGPPTVPDATTQSTTGVESSGAALALSLTRPNPTFGEAIRVSLTLPSTEAATLELLDVAGRRLLKRDVGSRVPGAHLVLLTPSPPLRPGLYFLRLSQGPQQIRARVAVIR